MPRSSDLNAGLPLRENFAEKLRDNGLLSMLVLAFVWDNIWQLWRL
jgi:hypothetical protein